MAGKVTGDMPRPRKVVPVATTMPVPYGNGGANTLPAGYLVRDSTGKPLGSISTTAKGELPIKPTIASNGMPFEVNRRSGGHPLSGTASDASASVVGTVTATGAPFPWGLVIAAGVVWFVFFHKKG